MQLNPVIWFEIYVQEMARAKAFYEAVLQVQLISMDAPDMKYQAFPWKDGAEGAAGALAQMEGMPSGGSGTLVYFACQDCAVEAQRASAHGGRIVKDKFSIGEHGFVALVQDTEGNTIGLHSMK